MTLQKHSWVGPSRLSRCRICPGCVRLCRSLPPKDQDDQRPPTPEQAEGTLKHTHFTEIILGNRRKTEFDDVKWCVDATREIIRFYGGRKNVVLIAEEYLPLTDIGIEGGTPDLAIIIPGSHIVLIEEKYGYTPVEHPKNNDQIKAYSWGLWNEYGGICVNALKLQPNCPFEDQRRQMHTFRAEDMDAVAEEIRRVVSATEDPDAALVRGTHCDWCPAKRICPQFSDALLMVPRGADITSYLRQQTPHQRAKLLEDVRALSKWAEMALQEIITNGTQQGVEFEGYQPAPTRNTNVWTDEDAAEAKMRELKKAHPKVRIKDIVRVKRELASPSKAMELFGRSRAIKEMLSPLIRQVPGKNLTLKKVRHESS